MSAKIQRANRSPDGQLLLFGAAVILFATLLAYQPALKAGFIWDDDDMLFQNPLVTDADGLRSIWFSTKFYDYFPLTLSSLWIEWRIWGGHATGYHVTNILLHAFASVFFWRCLKYLKIPGAWLIAFLFAVHPVNVESVAWITERKNTLSLFFYGLSLLFFLRFENRTAQATQHRKHKGRHSQYWLSLGAFILALLSKTSVVMLPIVLLGCMWWRNGGIRRAEFLRIIPFFVLSLALSAVTIWFQYNRAIAMDIVREHSFWGRLAGAGWAIWFYLYKIIVPFELSFVYPRWTIDSRSLVSFLPIIAVMSCLGLFWFYRKTWGRPCVFAFGYFVATLFPVLGFFNIYFQKYSLVADHWQYPSLIGPLAFIVAGFAFVLKKISGKIHPAKPTSPRLPFQPQPIFAGIAAGIFLGILTFNQTKIYANPETLWRDTVKKNPKAWIAHNLLGTELAARGEIDQAMECYSEAIRLNPNHAEARSNLGTASAMRGDFGSALEHLRAACRLKPELIISAKSLAWILATHPNPRFRNGTEAVLLAERAAKLTKEKDASILETLAAALAEAGNFSGAIKTVKQGINLANACGEMETATDLAAQLRLYELHRPLRDTSLAAN